MGLQRSLDMMNWTDCAIRAEPCSELPSSRTERVFRIAVALRSVIPSGTRSSAARRSAVEGPCVSDPVPVDGCVQKIWLPHPPGVGRVGIGLSTITGCNDLHWFCHPERNDVERSETESSRGTLRF